VPDDAFLASVQLESRSATYPVVRSLRGNSSIEPRSITTGQQTAEAVMPGGMGRRRACLACAAAKLDRIDPSTEVEHATLKYAGPYRTTRSVHLAGNDRPAGGGPHCANPWMAANRAALGGKSFAQTAAYAKWQAQFPALSYH